MPRRNRFSVLVEGVEFTFLWDKFAIGDGVFIPCIDTVPVLREIRNSARRNKIRVRTRVGEFDGKWGVAVWKTT